MLWGQDHQWRAAGLRYFSYKFFLQKQFGVRVQRVSVDGGFVCPNVDGRVGCGGCVFCDNRSFSPSRRLTVSRGQLPSISEQLDQGVEILRRRYPDCEHVIAYFQPATNTYAPLDRLRALYSEAMSHPRVVGLAIGTRPDCVPDAVLDLLEQVARQTFLSVEFGMQTVHARSLAWMNRGHGYDAMVDAVTRSRGRGFEIGAHIILGLPGESRRDMLETAREIARLQLHAVKLHNLYAVDGTPLGEEVRRGKVQLIDRDTYVNAVVDVLEVIPPQVLVQRLGGDAPRRYLVGPTWSLDKAGLHEAIDRELKRRDTWQGKQAVASPAWQRRKPNRR